MRQTKPATKKDTPGSHMEHSTFHYRENEVRTSVNKRKRALTKRYGKQPSLMDES